MNLATQEKPTPRLGAAQIDLLEKLCNACAVSGNESEVRAIVLEQVRSLLRQRPGEVKVDALGNVLVSLRGAGENRLRVMLAAHMDEVGFMLTDDEGDGVFRFEPVGGVDARYLAGKSVLVGRNHTPGIIGIEPIHLAGSSARRAPEAHALRIDLGPGNGGHAKVGDWATFSTQFSRLGQSLRAKALDNRLGVATLLELLRHAPAHLDLLAAFTVQEEVGLRGAAVAAFALDPQVALVLDATPAYDLPDWQALGSHHVPEPGREHYRYNTRLGAGPAIYVADARTISDPRLVAFLSHLAEEKKIPFQFRQPGGGGTDAGAIHKSRAGIPSVSISVPIRYAHTPASLARLDDWKNYLALLQQALSRLTPEILTSER